MILSPVYASTSLFDCIVFDPISLCVIDTEGFSLHAPNKKKSKELKNIIKIEVREHGGYNSNCCKFLLIIIGHG